MSKRPTGVGTVYLGDKPIGQIESIDFNVEALVGMSLRNDLHDVSSHAVAQWLSRRLATLGFPGGFTFDAWAEPFTGHLVIEVVHAWHTVRVRVDRREWEDADGLPAVVVDEVERAFLAFPFCCPACYAARAAVLATVFDGEVEANPLAAR